MNRAVVITRQALCASCTHRCPAHADGTLDLHASAGLCALWAGRSPACHASTQPAPWPPQLEALRAQARPSDRGAGDVIAREIGEICGSAFRLWYETQFGRPCRCTWDRVALNARWPL